MLLSVWVATRVFLVMTEFFGSVLRQWVLCRDMIWYWYGVPGLGPCLLSVEIMLLQRFPYHDRDGHNKRSGLRRSLVKAKRFHVATEIYNVATRVHEVMSR